jgi:hypothetical protein
VTDGNFFIAQIMLFIHKKSKKVKISEKKYSFFSTLNQYFPHIPYVASKKERKNVQNSLSHDGKTSFSAIMKITAILKTCGKDFSIF